MGIRYLGISVDQQDYERIAAGPCPTCGARPHRREAEYDEPEPETLDLDKSWGYLQRFLGQDPPRAGQLLVAGQVTNTSRGWIPYQGAINPADVPAIAADLASVTAESLRRYFQQEGQWIDDRSEEDFRYVTEHLKQAVEFVRKVATDRRGIVYYIG